MKFFHLSDLHIGKQLHYYSLKENQQHIFRQIVEKAKEYRPDVILICGDVFDKSVPSAEACEILDEFLNMLSEIQPQIPVLMIAGNHDNPKRLGYAREFFRKHGIYISILPPQEQEESIEKIQFTDEWGKVNFYLLPFFKPGYVRHLFPEGEITDYGSALEALLKRDGIAQGQISSTERNVLLSHQFFVDGTRTPETCDSEQWVTQVGGLDSIQVSLVEHFDYVALGHIHSTQKIRAEHIRYCGTPLKYSVSEAKQKKSITMVTLQEKGTSPVIQEIPLTPLRELRRVEGSFSEILAEATPENCHDFLSITLTDDTEIYHPLEQLEEKYDFILELRMDNQRTRSWTTENELEFEKEGLKMTPLEVFASFYQEMRGVTMSLEEEELLRQILLEEEGE